MPAVQAVAPVDPERPVDSRHLGAAGLQPVPKGRGPAGRAAKGCPAGDALVLQVPGHQIWPGHGSRERARPGRTPGRGWRVMDHEAILRAAERSAAFLRVADQFQLGHLLTESSHPVTARLSEVARTDLEEALRLLFTVDGEVVERYRREVESERMREVATAVGTALDRGGRLFFTGCGSTGRLSILLVAMWREFWQRARATGQVDPGQARAWEDRAYAVMAGGDYALIRAVEGFEDYPEFGRKQLMDLGVRAGDVVFAITEGGETPFVIGTAWQGLEAGATVYFVYNNPDDPLRARIERSRAVLEEPRIRKWNLATGPMAIRGSTRMQATSIQMAVLGTVLEMVLRERCPGQRGPGSGGAETVEALPWRVLSGLEQVHHTLLSAPVRRALADWVRLESGTYAAGRRVNYYADSLAADLLTDTTERSPTYCVPPFRKFDDPDAADSWAFLFVPCADTASAWEHVCKRRPRCIEWSEEEIRGWVPPENLPRTLETVRRIGYGELMRYRIGEDGLEARPLRSGDTAVVLMGGADVRLLRGPAGFFARQLDAARTVGAAGCVVGVGNAAALEQVARLLDRWRGGFLRPVLIETPSTNLWLDGLTHLTAKLVLNAVSTATMVRLGRVMGNLMVWVVPSNLKLVDRGTRYIQQLTGLDYAASNRLLFEALEYVSPRMQSDRAYPPVVALAVLRHRLGLDWEEAERRLWSELGWAGSNAVA